MYGDPDISFIKWRGNCPSGGNVRGNMSEGGMFYTLCMDHNVGPSVNMSDTENLTAELKNNSM